ncbi:uncharacterized protein G2W53_015343 [Senna tora]|uniref:Uncharacterized protein n=1 Tax=Senna tora TaxID=362788 RepID=A0A835C7F3_9FABA|nr:uncharacterized protein G2W53_015343 [Senna tora]
MGQVIASKVCEVTSKHNLNQKSRLNLKRIQEVHAKRVLAQVSKNNPFALYLGIRGDLMFKWDK